MCLCEIAWPWRKFKLGDVKSEKMEPEGDKREPKGRQLEPKGRPKEGKWSQREPRVSQRAPKTSQGEPKGSQRWAQGRPKCIKKSTFGKGRENDGNYGDRRHYGGITFGAIFHQKSMNKSMWKSMPKQLWKLMKNRCEYEATIWSFSSSVFI